MMLPLPTASPRNRAWYVFAGLWVLVSIVISTTISEEIFRKSGLGQITFSFLVFSLAAFLPIIHDWVVPQWKSRWVFLLAVVVMMILFFLLLTEGFFHRGYHSPDDEFILFVFLAWSVAYFIGYWLTGVSNNSEEKQRAPAYSAPTDDPSPLSDRPVKASVWRYISAWVVASLSSGFAVSALYWVLATSLNTPSNFSSGSYWIIAPISGGILSLIIWIAVYSFFSNLLISKVVPWMWGLMGLGYFSTIGQVFSTFDEIGHEIPGGILFAFLASYLLIVLGFSRYFQVRQPSRY